MPFRDRFLFFLRLRLNLAEAQPYLTEREFAGKAELYRTVRRQSRGDNPV